MALGVHSFYGYSIADTNRLDNKQDYYIGCMTGDHFADEQFAQLINRLQQRLKNRLSHYTYCWSPLIAKPYQPRTTEQKLSTAIKKATNKHVKKVQQIKDAGYLFEADFIKEEEMKLTERKQALTDRYGQANDNH